MSETWRWLHRVQHFSRKAMPTHFACKDMPTDISETMVLPGGVPAYEATRSIVHERVTVPDGIDLEAVWTAEGVDQ